MGENGRLHSRRARCFIEVLHRARCAGNRTVHLLDVSTQLGLIPPGPVFAFIGDRHPAAQAARFVQEVDHGEVTAAEMLPAMQAGELGLAESLPPPATETT